MKTHVGILMVAVALASQAQADEAPAPDRALASSTIAIHFKNELGKTLTLVEAQVTLDGERLPVVGELRPGEDMQLFSGPARPGHHLVTTRVVCRGTERGPISYVKDYRWTASADQVLTVPDGRMVVYTIAAKRVTGAKMSWNKPIEIVARDKVVGPDEPFTP
jgi:hypothetical protein